MEKKIKEKKLNARQKKYAILRASGMMEETAFKKAGYIGNGKQGNPTQLEKKVEKEIKRIQERQEEKILDLAKECQHLAPEAMIELAELLKHKKAPQVQIRAIQEVFDRGFGKPRETIDTGVTVKWDIGIKRVE
jgi:hypothetical protein